MDALRLLFLRKHNLATPLVRLVTWSSWSHVTLVTPDDTIIEASAWHGVRERPLPEAIGEASRHALADVPCPCPADGLRWARAQIGKPYDWLGVIGLGLHREWNDPARWWCSEFVEGAIAAAGRPRFRADVPRITPEHSWMVA